MESILIKIQSQYGAMGHSDKKIADFILNHHEDMISLSISELSALCKCSDATVVRFAKKLGLSGYQALKISVAQQSGSNAQVIGVTPEDSCFDIFSKHINEIALTLEKTRAVLDNDALAEAADSIIGAKTIAIFGLGSSSSVAYDAQHKFMRAGLHATAYSDNHMQAIIASHLTEGDVAIGISHSGSSIDVVYALEVAKKRGATTICITSMGTSPIIKVSDIVLFTNADETRYTILAMSSRIAQLAILDTIYRYIVIHSPAAAAAINDTESALQVKKY